MTLKRPATAGSAAKPMAKRKHNRSNGGRVRTKLPFIQNDICPSTDNLAPGDFFPEAQKSPDPLLPPSAAQTDWSPDRPCRLDLSGAPAQFQPAIRPEGPDGGDALPQWTARQSRLSPSSSSADWPAGTGTKTLHCTGCRATKRPWPSPSLSLPVSPSAQKAWIQDISRLCGRLDCARPSPTPLH